MLAFAAAVELPQKYQKHFEALDPDSTGGRVDQITGDAAELAFEMMKGHLHVILVEMMSP